MFSGPFLLTVFNIPHREKGMVQGTVIFMAIQLHPVDLLRDLDKNIFKNLPQMRRCAILLTPLSFVKNI